MAKSKGNFFTLRDLIEKGYDPLEIRYLLVSVRYRKQLNFTFEGLRDAKNSLDRIKGFMFRLTATNLRDGTNPKLAAAIATAREQFEAALDDDLNTSAALAAFWDLVREANVGLDHGELKAADREEILKWFQVVDERLAIIPPLERLVQGDEEIEALVARRNEARRNRDFATSDKIKNELLDRGVIIEDTREGTRWRRK
jgi:cysteinyl-tRNA synthetase